MAEIHNVTIIYLTIKVTRKKRFFARYLIEMGAKDTSLTKKYEYSCFTSPIA